MCVKGLENNIYAGRKRLKYIKYDIMLVYVN